MAGLTINIPPDIEAYVREKARRQQMSEERYVIEWMRKDINPLQVEKEKKLKALEDIAEKSRRLLTAIPPLDDDAVALSYEERADRQLQ